MHENTATFRNILESAKSGNADSLDFCRHLLARSATSESTPAEAIVALSECLLNLGIEQARKDVEAN